MTETQLRRRRKDLYTVVPSNTAYYTFHGDGEDVVAAFYSAAGTWVSDRGRAAFSVGGNPGNNNPTLIAVDEQGLVGPGSLAWVAPHEIPPTTPGEYGQVCVFDPVGGVLLTLDITEGFYCKGVGYKDGYLFWVECANEQHSLDDGFATTFVLWRARCDLSSPEVVTEYEFPNLFEVVGSPGFSVDWPSDPVAIFTSHAASIERGWVDNINNEVSGSIRIRLPLDGAAAEFSEVSMERMQAAPDASGGAFGGDPTGDFFGRRIGDSVTAVPADLWPNDVSHWGVFGDPVNVSVSLDGSEGALYSSFDGELVRNSLSAIGSEPSVHLNVAPHPEFATLPILLFIKG